MHPFFCFLIWINVFCFALMQRGAMDTVISFTIHQDDLDVNLINVIRSLLLCVISFQLCFLPLVAPQMTCWQLLH